MPIPLDTPAATTLDAVRLALVVLAAAAGGAVNSIAGGGTLLTFPALVGLGVPPVVANATSTVALWPGALGSIWGYRGELAGMRRWSIRFAVPSATGGLVGALLLLRTSPDHFAAIVPWLVFMATLLFVAQRPFMEWLRNRESRRPGSSAPDSRPTHSESASRLPTSPSTLSTPDSPSSAVLFFQFLVAIYGGYFGAGIGILMLAALGFMGFTHIHRMNGLKNWGGLCINAVAAATFIVTGLVNWPVALAMAAGAIAGGYGGSRLAQRVQQQRVRQAIIAIGFASALWLLLEQL